MTRAADARLTPEAKKEREDARIAAKAKRLKLMRCANSIFNSEEGTFVLRYLAETCGQRKTSIVGDPRSGDILDRGTFYNEVRRGLYLEITNLLKPEIVMRAEFSGEAAAQDPLGEIA